MEEGVVKEVIFKQNLDGTLEKRTRTGSYRTVQMETLSKEIQNTLGVLSLADSGTWVAGVGGVEKVNNPSCTFFYVCIF
jgi:hypothetical protein